MALPRHPACQCSRIVTNRKIYRFLLIFISTLFLILLVIHRTNAIISNNTYELDYAIPYKINSDLISKNKILVPVSIDRLYDFRVVCTENGFLNRNQLIKQVSSSCQTNLSVNLTLNLNPPVDFQIRSSLPSKYIEFNPVNPPCSVFQNETLAIIISYRDREKNLQKLLFNLIPFLRRQRVTNYRIFIIEQKATGAFNKGRLYNIGFYHVMKTYRPTCVIFHGSNIYEYCEKYSFDLVYLDVDLIPENNQNFYSCTTLTNRPLHMSSYVRSEPNGQHSIIYPFLVGGVLAFLPETFILLNGYSNQYFNWGGEDDDMGLRMLAKDVCVQRPTTGFYYAASHGVQTRNKDRFKLLFHAVLRQNTDGLNNIDKLARVINIYEYPLVTWITVDWMNTYLSMVS